MWVCSGDDATNLVTLFLQEMNDGDGLCEMATTFPLDGDDESLLRHAARFDPIQVPILLAVEPGFFLLPVAAILYIESLPSFRFHLPPVRSSSLPSRRN